MPASIRNGLRKLDAVLTYGLDGLADQNAESALLHDLGLSPEVFFRELYVSRPATEAELLAQMDSGALHTFVVGPIGCGKTTLLHHVLREYCGQRRLPTLLIDMKTAGIVRPDVYSIADRIEGECKRLIALYLKTYRWSDQDDVLDPFQQPTLATLAMLLLEPQFRQHISALHFGPVHRLDALYAFSPECQAKVGFMGWLSSQLTSESSPGRSQVTELMTTFTVSLGLSEVAFAVAELARRKSGQERRSKLVIAIDNLDAIEDPKLREQLVEWMRSQSGSYSPVITFTACVRPQNIQPAGGNVLDTKALWGEEGSPVLKLSVGESDVQEATLREWETYLNGQFYDRALDDEEYRDLALEERQRRAFDDMVHVKRVSFVSDAVAKGLLHEVKVEDLLAVSKAAKEVLNVGSVATDIRMQANGNRRVMLAGVANFLEYVVRDLELDWEHLGVARGGHRAAAAVRELRGSAIKSLYYRFLGSAHAGQIQPPVFDEKVFDPVGVVLASGWKGRRLDTDHGATDVTKRCRDLLVLLGVYNACGNTLSYWSEEAVPVLSVAKCCERLGLKTSDVYESIENVVRCVGVRFAGVFDIDHFLLIHRGARGVEGNERIVATDRCRRLLSVVIYMFNFLCERLKQSGGFPAGHSPEDRELAHRGLVAPRIVEAFPDWLAKAVTVETWWIEAVQTAHGATTLKTAYERYCNEFVVKRAHGGSGQLLTQGIARSAIAYLEFCIEKQIYPHEGDVLECYKLARDSLGRIEAALQAVGTRLRRGELWGIPRNEPLPY